MSQISLSQHVNAEPAKVFAVFTDLANAPARVQGIEKLELLTDGPVGVGTRFRETRIMFKKEATEEMAISAFEADKSYTVTSESCGALYTTVFNFEPDDAGTRVDCSFRVKPLSFFAKLMSPLGWMMRGTLKKCLLQDIEDLKKVAEQPND